MARGKVHTRNRPRRPRAEAEVQVYSFFNIRTRWGWLMNPGKRPGTQCLGGNIATS